MNLMFFINSAALGVGLSMDAFAISLANGLHESTMPRRRMCLVAGVYALFQYAMPMIGWICVHAVVELFSSFSRFIPWIALVLLLYIGGKMLLEGLRERSAAGEDPGLPAARAAGEESSRPKKQQSAASGAYPGRRLSFRSLILQGFATAIDALSVGFTIAPYSALMANLAALIIGIVTFFICMGGLAAGKKAGTALTWKATILGGCILMVIGLEIFMKGMIGL